MANWTNGKPQIASKEDLEANWRGDPRRESFRCYMCGHRFMIGDVWRWVYAGGTGCINFLTCEKCDGEDVLQRWIANNKIAYEKYWWK